MRFSRKRRTRTALLRPERNVLPLHYVLDIFVYGPITAQSKKTGLLLQSPPVICILSRIFICMRIPVIFLIFSDIVWSWRLLYFYSCVFGANDVFLHIKIRYAVFAYHARDHILFSQCAVSHVCLLCMIVCLHKKCRSTHKNKQDRHFLYLTILYHGHNVNISIHLQ